MKTTFLFLVITFSVAFLAGIAYGVDLGMALIGALASWFAFGKFAMCFQFFEGHGVGLVKGKLIQGLPFYFVAYYAVVCLLAIALISLGVRIEDVPGVPVLGFGFLTGLVMVMVYWFAVAKDEYFHGSKYCALMEFKDKKDEPEIAALKVQHLKSLGVIKK